MNEAHVSITQNGSGKTLTVYSYDNDLVGIGSTSVVHWELVETDGTLTVLSDEDMYSIITNSEAFFADITGAREYTCDSGVAINEWVYISAADTVDEAQADSLATMPCCGVVVYKRTTTSCLVKQYGYLYDESASYTAGDEYYVSDATAGAITNVAPGVWPQRVGIAKNSECMKILLGDNLGLALTNIYSMASGTGAIGEWVYITATDDTVDEALADAAATMPSIGVIVEVVDATTVRVKTGGKFSEASKGWTAGDKVYIDPSTAGAVTNTIPVGHIVQQVATVKSDDATTIIYELT